MELTCGGGALLFQWEVFIYEKTKLQSGTETEELYQVKANRVLNQAEMATDSKQHLDSKYPSAALLNPESSNFITLYNSFIHKT